MATADPEESRAAAIADSKRLLRRSRTAALATLSADGAPLATWVGCASDLDGSPLFLLSTLAQHTKDIAGDARGSLLLTSPSDRGDPLNHPRLTVGGSIRLHPDPYAQKRYLQRNPKAKLYASFSDFAIYRMAVERVHFNGGFGRADKLAPADILISGDAAALVAAEDALLAEINDDSGLAARLAGHDSWPARLAGRWTRSRGRRSGGWRRDGAGRFSIAGVRSGCLAQAPRRGARGARVVVRF